jgi:hypothetical protein
MSFRFTDPVRRRVQVIAGASVLALSFGLGAGQAIAKPDSGGTISSKPSGDNLKERAGFYDSRQDAGALKELRARAATLAANPKAGVQSLRKELGIQGVIAIDPLTSTARAVARLDGFLTGPSGAPASTIALNYVATHADVFGLDSNAISRLVLRRDYVDIAGTHHLSYLQQVGGIPVFGNGLQANVAKNGSLINVVGSPVANLPSAAAGPGMGADKARESAIKDVRHDVKSATSQKAGRRAADHKVQQR